MAALQYEELFEQTGQYESITTRIRSILREYKDGISIFKELIQNADDAGATTVKFLVDWRQGRTDSLFSPGMAECQGPALWAFNDAVFTDKDFENINMLAGETKLRDLSKIGRFGLGFNAVYHITDVPSFLSREHFVVFDPNIHHLQHHIRDRSRPGIRINLIEKPETLTSFKDQFQPYDGIFGCNTAGFASTRGSFYYQGTLFRFPFRTAFQARTSDICETDYGRDRIEAIVRSLCECASTLLVFSQYVKKVELYELNQSFQPEKMHLVLSVDKPSVEVFKEQGVNKEEAFIKQCSEWWLKYLDSKNTRISVGCLSSCELVNMVTTKEVSKLGGCACKYKSDQMWVIVSVSGENTSLEIACSPEGRANGYLPCGGAAIMVQEMSKEGSWETRITPNGSGELFCFLPLSIVTGLPVHVNGDFAIMPNRVEVWKRNNMQRQPIQVKWNEALMEDVLAKAYIILLENINECMAKIQHYQFHTLWPCNTDVDMKSWQRLVHKVCNILLDPKSKFFRSDGIWMSISDGFLLSEDFEGIYKTAIEVLKSLGEHVFDLPSNIFLTLLKFDQQGILRRRTLSFTVFLEYYFFPNISSFFPTQREAIICFGLDRILHGNKSSTGEFSLLQQNPCIAVTEDTGILAKPSELVDPFSAAAKLFSQDDRRFPVGNRIRHVNRLYVLRKLGMKETLEWADIFERAESISRDNSIERSRALIQYINKHIDELPLSKNYRLDLQNLKFLPVLRNPVPKYFLTWKGTGNVCWSAPNEVFLPEYAKLVGSSCLIVNTSSQTGCGKLTDEVANFLGFSTRQPDVIYVIQQLDETIKFWSELCHQEMRSTKFAIESICQKIYSFLNDKVVQSGRNHSFLNELRKRHWLFLHGQFVQTKKVAFTSKGNGVPFLFTLPPTYQKDYRHLFEAMNIQQSFDHADYIGALYELDKVKNGSMLNEDELQIAVFFIGQIDAKSPTVGEYIGEIPLPDTDCILRRSKDLVVNLSLWLEDPGDNLKVHEKIAPQTALAFGTKSLKNVTLNKRSYSIGYEYPFGQHEELTDRLKGILEEYPATGVLKELVQNADDAEASEIHFVYDTRSLGCERVVVKSSSCKEVQGPALCVYNDRPFEKKDIDGIKNLGVGTKEDTINKIGRYGIGFNCVYHLTDCPSFLSNNNTLVIFDPHRRYVHDGDQGKLLKLSGEELRKKFSDTFDGYLSDHFVLEGSTMFRFPLRQRNHESKVSSMSPDMKKLMQAFQEEARRSLLFLNHLKKITLSRIDSTNKLKIIYQVETLIASGEDKKRQKLSKKIAMLSNTPTANIKWEGVSYQMNIKENKKDVEKWLVQKCIGSTKEHDEIPDGRKLSLFPLGGVAARLWADSQKKEFHGMVYCFLPLPESNSGLPVHVNGYFALDNSRRGLWTETDEKGSKCEWNNFLKSCVLPPAYAALIQEARVHLCDHERDKQLSCYHALFPKVIVSPWKSLVIGFYRYLAQTRAKVFPLVVPTESDDKSTFNGSITHCMTGTDTFEALLPQSTSIEWLSADQVYFRDPNEKDDFLHFLLRIGLRVLLFTPYKIYKHFISAEATTHKVSPKSVISFLAEFESENSTCKIAKLPRMLENTVIKSIQELLDLIAYCDKDEHFKENLASLPLLLTQDGNLRVFEACQPVYHTAFGDLFPTQLHLFTHRDIYNQISLSDETKIKVIREFTIRDLASLLPDVFTNKVLRAIKKGVTWKFPDKGVLSEAWFQRFWDFLQNNAKPAPNEGIVSLKYLSEWPVIPTTSGKLTTIKNAKTVLDMTITGRESNEKLRVNKFLKDLNCPELNKNITFKQGAATASGNSVLEWKPPITDPYVSHPHNVTDILIVLQHHLTWADKVDLSKFRLEDVLKFLEFLQNNYEASNDLDFCKTRIKRLPFHKTLNGEFVSLDGLYTLCTFVPSGVPTQQLNELQERVGSLFLNSDVLPMLGKLYEYLGVKAVKNVVQFYVDYVLQHFNVFTLETQMKHLFYIRDEVYPKSSLLEKTFLQENMSAHLCIPDENGNLHLAQEFFDSRNKLFKLMFQDDPNKFPPMPFNDEVWFDLLEGIGLQVNITPELFLEFARTIGMHGARSSNDQVNHVKSKELVNVLFSEKTLQSEEFLKQVSQIEFIAPATVGEELNLIHDQYKLKQYGCLPFNKFSNAVLWEFRYEAWTTAAILPNWPELNRINNYNLLTMLDVACCGPEYTQVITHLQNIANAYNPDLHDSGLMHQIIKSIYQFLSQIIQYCGCISNDQCSATCMDVGNRLNNIPCIFLQNELAFVKADQLVFRLPEKFDLRPFLYTVPKELLEFEHFLKRLEATEKPTPLQIVSLLNAIHGKLGDATLSAKLEKKVKYAVHILFELFYRGEPSERINEIYLPSQDKKLAKSSEMICKVPQKFMDEVMENLGRSILLSLQECGLKRAADDYIDALPEKLRLAKFEDIVRKELDSECKALICPKAEQRSICKFQEKFQSLLQSVEFREGLSRLFIADCLDPRKFEGRVKNLQANLQIKCIGFDSLKIHIVNRESNQILCHFTDSCYVLESEETSLLYMQHGLKDVDKLISTATCINKILGDCIKREKELISMLSCSSPGDILTKLYKLDIIQSASAEDRNFDELDDDLFGWEAGDERDNQAFGIDRPGAIGRGTCAQCKTSGDMSGGGSGAGYRGNGGLHGVRSLSSEEEIEDTISYPKSREEAERWFQQSKSDLASARWLLQSGPPFSAHACFQSHQVVEKCLKAMMFSHVGISGRLLESHKLDLLAGWLRDTTGMLDEEDILLVNRVSHYYLSTRYPNRQPRNIVPAEAFDKYEAEKAVDAATKLINKFC